VDFFFAICPKLNFMLLGLVIVHLLLCNLSLIVSRMEIGNIKLLALQGIAFCVRSRYIFSV